MQDATDAIEAPTEIDMSPLHQNTFNGELPLKYLKFLMLL